MLDISKFIICDDICVSFNIYLKLINLNFVIITFVFLRLIVTLEQLFSKGDFFYFLNGNFFDCHTLGEGWSATGM